MLWIFSVRPDPPVELPVGSAGRWGVPSQWPDRVLTLATRAFPDVHAQAIPRLCYGAEDKDAGMYAQDGGGGGGPDAVFPAFETVSTAET